MLISLKGFGDFHHAARHFGPGYFITDSIGWTGAAAEVTSFIEGLAHVDEGYIGNKLARSVVVAILPDVGMLEALTICSVAIRIVLTNNVKCKILSRIGAETSAIHLIIISTIYPERSLALVNASQVPIGTGILTFLHERKKVDISRLR